MAWSGGVVAGDESGANRELVRSESEGLAGNGLGDTVEFEEDVAGTHGGDPVLGLTLTFAHSDFRRALGDWLVREDAAENIAFALEEAGDGDAAGFDVDILDPATLKGLESEVAEVELVATGGIATTVAALMLAIFNSAG
jgi:hypothetical protein